MNVLIVCGVGIGTSLMMKIKLKQFASDHKLDIMVESCGLDEAKGSLRDYDILVCSTHLVEDMGTIPEKTQLITVENIMDVNVYGEKIKAIVNGG